MKIMAQSSSNQSWIDILDKIINFNEFHRMVELRNNVAPPSFWRSFRITVA